ncbi:AzlC family ABC transporter permease [Cytobacillus depressus]|uniref:AzlC family ABC transporter permease n=1 Tax=Cytobacillus depressus TaxID=1602942 RepID=A0A6L3V6T0_9BACI|nr:AzlC family ABC transporter permease [Cytobacillus depressus]KAB2337154.1 AzlC family ABC transporter permease [Cytobacillus depressus]
MAELAMNKSQSEFRKGLQSGISISIGYIPVALTFGLLAKTTGLSFSETVLMSFVVFAGASQYISLSLLSLGTGIFEIILTTFIVNIRHFLMSSALNERCEDDDLVHKAVYSFGITDESFSVAAMNEGKVTTGYMYGLNLIGYFSWGIATGFGYLLGASLPQTLQESMTIALYAMFIGLLVPSMKKSVKVVFLAALAACFNTIFTLTETLSTGWAIVAATLLSSVIVELIEGMKNKQRRKDDE